MTGLSGLALFGASFGYLVFLPLGLFRLAELRLNLAPTQMPVALGLLCVGGLSASIWAGKWMETRGATLQRRLNLLGWCGGLLAGLALLSLGITSPLDVDVLCGALGIIMGLQITVAASLVFDALPPAARWLWCGAAVVAVSIVGHDPWLVFERPERVSGIMALVAAALGWAAWSRQHAACPVSRPEGEEPGLTLSPGRWQLWVCTLGVLGGFAFYRMRITPELEALVWGSTLRLWLVGFVQAAVAIGLALRMLRSHCPRFSRTLAVVCLLALSIMVARPEVGITVGWALPVTYAVGMAPTLLLCMGLWPLCFDDRVERRLGWTVGAVCWFAVPVGVVAAALT